LLLPTASPPRADNIVSNDFPDADMPDAQTNDAPSD
jgi:hypothetical protein